MTTRRDARSAAAAAQDAARSTIARKRRHYGVDYPEFYDRDLRRLFSDAPEFAGNMRRVAVHRAHPPVGAARRSPTGPAIYQYTIDQVLEDMIERCRAAEAAAAPCPKTRRASSSPCCSPCRP